MKSFIYPYFDRYNIDAVCAEKVMEIQRKIMFSLRSYIKQIGKAFVALPNILIPIWLEPQSGFA